MKPHKNVAKLLKNSRVNKKLSQGELSYSIGINKSQTISNIERGVSPLPLKYAETFCLELGISVCKIKKALIADYVQYLDERLG